VPLDEEPKAIPEKLFLVDVVGIEPTTSSMPSKLKIALSY
jgi:hypothetical protein